MRCRHDVFATCLSWLKIYNCMCVDFDSAVFAPACMSHLMLTRRLEISPILLVSQQWTVLCYFFISVAFSMNVTFIILGLVCDIVLSLFCWLLFRLHRMHEMQTIVTDVRSVCLSVCLSRSWIQQRVQCVQRHSVQALPNDWPLVRT